MPARPPAIDWSAHYAQITALIAHYARPTCTKRGWELEDVIAGTVLRIIENEKTPSRYDPARSSLSNYVWIATRSYLSHLAETAQARISAHTIAAPVRLSRTPDPSPAMDDVGLDDEQIATMADLLLDARLTLAERRTSLPLMRDSRGRYISRAESADISYRALLTWLRCDRDVAHTCRITGLSEGDLLAYLGWVVGTLERYGDEPYRRVWAAIRQSVRRRRQWAREALAEAAVEAP